MTPRVHIQKESASLLGDPKGTHIQKQSVSLLGDPKGTHIQKQRAMARQVYGPIYLQSQRNLTGSFTDLCTSYKMFL